MKFCANCGNGNEDDSKFCRKCGAAFGGGDTIIGQPPPPPASMHTDAGKTVNRPAVNSTAAETPTSGTDTTPLALNVAHFLCYVAGWITGLVFLLIEKKEKSTRFHAWQSILTFAAITVLWLIVVLLLFILSAIRLYSISMFLSPVLWIVFYVGGTVLWILLMVKAYQGQDFHLPVVGSIADNLAYGNAEKPQKAAPAAIPVDLPPLPAKKGVDKTSGTKFCISCGESLPSKAMFCARCGEKQP
jgi:uncharacterized membrane protein